ncbi:MAG: alcohol dehydrogenase catalytic domain-containing protein, partial [Anaerolineaceae bacterium]|nr:alcohol dehydrogenase catalytic domain-containing protein [Anaerolineaceae bacterium]
MVKTRTTIFTGPKQLEVREVELPEVGPHQVLVKVRACALCTWEQRFYKGSSPQDYPFRGGHEVSGEVVALGSQAVCDARVGDPVSVAIMTRCGACNSCRRGMDNFCENDDGGALPGLPWGPGGLSDFALLEDYQVYKAAPGRDFCELALAEPVACVVRSATMPDLEMGDRVMVQGAGIMGLIHVMLLKHFGLRVMVSEPDETRRAKALEVGADEAANPLEDGFAQSVKDFTHSKNFNAVFFTAGGVPAIEQAMPLLSKGGWLCLYGSIHPKGPAQIDPNFVHYNEIVITGTFSHTKKSFRQAVEILSEKIIDVSPFISERIAFPDVQRGFERAISPDTY